MAPATLYGHVVASIEILFGMTFMAIFTGILFVRSRIVSSYLLHAIGGRSRTLAILDAVNSSFIALLGNQIEAELLANHPSQKTAHRMLLPICGDHHQCDRRASR